ncbi:MAG: hypothetical protein ACRD4B_04405 [Acidobacteriota bacterium]
MNRVLLAVMLSFLLIACKIEEKPDEPTAEETAVDALPENVGDKNTPTAIKALRGAKEVKKKIDSQRKEDAKVLQETN